MAPPRGSFQIRKKLSVTEVPGVFDATFTVGTETSNTVTINVQLRDSRSREVTGRRAVKWFLFSDANGDALATAITGVAAGTNGWVKESTTGQHGYAGSEADGTIDLVLTKSSGAQNVYLGLVMSDGSYKISTVASFAA